MDEDRKFEETVVTEEGETIADLRKVVHQIFSTADWRNPWAAYVMPQAVNAVKRAVAFFHGNCPEVVGVERNRGRVLMKGRGYLR